MTREEYIAQMDIERSVMDSNTVRIAKSANKFRPHDPELARMYDELERQCGNIAAYIGERLL